MLLRVTAAALAAAIAVAPNAACARAGDSDPPKAPPADGPANPSSETGPVNANEFAWMAAFPATTKQPIGLDEPALKKLFDKDFGGKWQKSEPKADQWDHIWKVLLLQTPSYEARVERFSISKYEVTNAQWLVFLQHRRETTKVGDESLRDVAARVWNIDANNSANDLSIQRGWTALLQQNEKVLLPILNPTNDPKWDPLVARAQIQKLPKGLEIVHSRFPAPSYWPKGELPEHERSLPVRGISWEQCQDFCAWAGFRLPLEIEWERAARGDDGRLYPWVGAWDPLKAVWIGYNALAKRSKDPAIQPVLLPGQTRDGAEGDTPRPMAVDALPSGATPEGVQHMLGNVSEFVADTLTLYPGAKHEFVYRGLVHVARGQNYTEKHPELVHAADRNYESSTGLPLAADHVCDGYGFRLASYENAGAEVSFAASLLWNDPNVRLFRASLPNSPGIARDAKGQLESDKYKGVEPHNAGGILIRQTDPAAKDFAFVQGPCTGLAFMPVRGWPIETVKSPSDVQRFSGETDVAVLLGVLLGSETSTIQMLESDAKDAKPVTLSMSDPRLFVRMEDAPHTRMPRGAALVLKGDRVWVHVPDQTIAGPERFRSKPLGVLALPAAIRADRGDPLPAGTLDKGVATLTSVIDPLDSKGQPMKKGAAARYVVTIKVPMLGVGSTTK